MKFFSRVLSRFKKQKIDEKLADDSIDISQREGLVGELYVGSNLGKNIKLIKEILGYSQELEEHRITIGLERVESALVFIDGMADSSYFNRHIAQPAGGYLFNRY